MSFGDAKREILAFLSKHGTASGAELRRRLGISRQATNVHVRALIEAGRIVKTGSTRRARYSLATEPLPGQSRRRDLRLKGLDESLVYDELATLLNLKSELRSNVETIVRYAFTEMLNNAIEHSKSERALVTMTLGPGSVSFEVRDRGVGVFHSIAAKLGLESEEAALLELVKGKTTTMPESHSGEGIFFVSKAGDSFALRSHTIEVAWRRVPEDVRVAEKRRIEGTDVRFSLRRSTRRRVESVFSQFAPEEFDFEFQRTKVLVRLLRSDYVSRSEAKRLTANLSKFREIILDFRGVKSLGQGFADEVFRVFPSANPGIAIGIQNARPVVASMISHVRRGAR
jgi:biotin operon repressor/anti-sigma regulatory factor (Ser/Thr protein kinase)